MTGHEEAVLISVEATIAGPRHCSNSCNCMIDAYCSVFACLLVWDKRRKYNGFLRCVACRKAEAK